MLTLETRQDGEMVALYGDPEGLRMFAAQLVSLIDQTRDGHFEHDHLMSQEWGGTSLSAEQQSADGRIVHHLKIYCIKGNKDQI